LGIEERREEVHAGQTSVGDRDEKLSEAIVYCKKTMRQKEDAGP